MTLEYFVPDISDPTKKMIVRVDFSNKVCKSLPTQKNKHNTKHNTKLPMELCSHIFKTPHSPKNGAASSLQFMKISENKRGPKELRSNERSVFLTYGTGGFVNPGKCEFDNISPTINNFTRILGNVHLPFYRYNPKTCKLLKGYPRYLPMSRFMNKGIKISNMVVTLKFPPNLIKIDIIHNEYSHRSKYCKEKFPACHMHFHRMSKVCFPMTVGFFNECVNISGLTSREQIEPAFWCVYTIINKTWIISKNSMPQKKKKENRASILNKFRKRIPTNWD